MEKLSVDIAQLDLDVLNPRIKVEDNQTEAMRSLLAVEKDGEKVFELARDICEIGMLDPGDRLYVVAAPGQLGRYIVLEGNRRLTALRLLSQPGMIDREDIGLNSAMRNKFKRLQTEHAGRWPVIVDIVVFEDRATANRFIRLRHTGENAGAGRSAWSSLQVARFDNTGLWQCLEFLRTERALDLVVINALDQSAFNITNFDRVSGTQEFQKRFGVSIGNFAFKITGDARKAKVALNRLACDVVSGRVDSRGEFAHAKGMANYLAELDAFASEVPKSSDEQPAPPTNVTPIRPIGQGGDDDITSNPAHPQGGNGGFADVDDHTPPFANPSPTSATATVQGNDETSLKPPRKQRMSKYLIDKKDLITVSNQKCRGIVDELKTGVEVQRAPFACALLLRTLQELSAELYLLSFSQKTSNNAANIDAAANHLLGNAHASDPHNRLELAKAFQESRNIYGNLSATAHNTISTVSSDHVRHTWSSLKGGMDLLWKRIYAQELAKKAAAAA